MAAEAVTTLPLGRSLPPMSTTFCWNFSFQAFQTGNISCIRAGDGGCWSRGARCRKRYFWLGISYLLSRSRRVNESLLDSSTTDCRAAQLEGPDGMARAVDDHVDRVG